MNEEVVFFGLVVTVAFCRYSGEDGIITGDAKSVGFEIFKQMPTTRVMVRDTPPSQVRGRSTLLYDTTSIRT